MLSRQCQTKFGHSLEKILGSTEEVKKFDKARKQLKENRHSKDLQNEYFYNVALMQTRISWEITRAKQQLKTWEKQYFTKHCKLPSSQDMLSKPTTKQLIDKIRFSKTVFSMLKKEDYYR